MQDIAVCHNYVLHVSTTDGLQYSQKIDLPYTLSSFLYCGLSFCTDLFMVIVLKSLIVRKLLLNLFLKIPLLQFSRLEFSMDSC